MFIPLAKKLSRALLVSGITIISLYTFYSVLSPLLGVRLIDQFINLLSYRGRLIFGDLSALLASAGCETTELSWMHGAPICNPDSGVFQSVGYPPLPILIGRTAGINESFTNMLGAVVGLAFLASIWISLNTIPGFIKRLALFSILTSAFGVQLGLERMNYDIIIYVLLFLLSHSIAIAEQQRRIWMNPANLLCLIFSFAAVSIKAYPGPGLVLWLLCEVVRTKKRLIPAHIFVGVGTFLGIITLVPWLLTGDNVPMPGIGIASHGLFVGLGYSNYPNWSSAISFTSFALSSGIFTRTCLNSSRFSRELTNYISEYKVLWINTVIGCTTWISCYCLNTNFDYRLIFLGPLVILCMSTYPVLTSSISINGCRIVFSVLLVKSFNPYIYQLSHDYGLERLRLSLGVLSKTTDLLGMPMLAGVLCALIASSTLLRHSIVCTEFSRKETGYNN